MLIISTSWLNSALIAICLWLYNEGQKVPGNWEACLEGSVEHKMPAGSSFVPQPKQPLQCLALVRVMVLSQFMFCLPCLPVVKVTGRTCIELDIEVACPSKAVEEGQECRQILYCWVGLPTGAQHFSLTPKLAFFTAQCQWKSRQHFIRIISGWFPPAIASPLNLFLDLWLHFMSCKEKVIFPLD